MRQSGWVKETRVIVFLILISWVASVNALDIVDSIQTYSSLSSTTVNMSGVSELHITSATNPITGCIINLNSVDSFFFLEQILPSVVQSTYLSQIRVNGAAAVLNTNVRVVEYVSGTVVIPHSGSYQPLQVYSGFNYTGSSMSLSQYTYYNSASLGGLNNHIRSFKLKRGYMATFAQGDNGTGLSRVYVAQDQDINIIVMPEELNDSVSFVCVFPWRWVSKKGSCDVDPASLNADWYYNWDINTNSTLDWEYVAIRQQPYWPGLSQDWRARGINHLLGFNEPDNPVEDSYKNLNNGSVDAAIANWPPLLATGLRVGAPAVTDGGLSWLYSFIDQANAAGLRVDYVPVHYYRCYSNNDNPTGAANQLYSFLKDIHDRTGLPVWLTEFNNGANWTGCTDPTYAQNASVINAMIQMMDQTPWIERYAIYSRVEAVRQTHYDEGGLTPMGTIYRDHVAPTAYIQTPGKAGFGYAYYPFEGNATDSLFCKNDGCPQGGAAYITGHSGQAIDLDGTNDYVILPENLADCTDFTFAAWVYWDVSSQNQRIFDFGSGTTYNMFLTPRSGSNQLRFAITTTSWSSEQALTYTQLSVNIWTHVAVTISGNTGKLFVNGSLVATNTNMTINPSDLKARNNYLGKSQYDDPYFNGRLDDVHIADYALTNAQIAALAAGTAANTAPVFLSNPVTKPDSLYGTSFSNSLVYDASDYDTTQMLTFSKLGGPAWLNVASNGTLSGIPSISDIGVNSFTVRVTDSAGAYSDATLNITVYGYGLRTYYTFDGNTNDSAGTKHGIATGSPVYGTGHTGQAITLDGTDDLVTLPAGVANSEDITIAAWVYWNGGNQWQRIFDFGTGTSQYFFISPRSGGDTLRFAMKNGGGEQYVETSQLATGQWVHVAVTLSGNTATLYVNGTSAATNTGVTINPSDINPTINYIGDSQFSADPLFTGKIDDFRIYNYGLSATQIATLYTGNTAPVFTSDPINNLGAVELEMYAGQSLASYATDVDGMNTVIFSKVSGPDWLAVAGNGALSGVPGNENVGANVFTVQVKDTGGLYDTAQMNIAVANIYSGVAGLDDLIGFVSQWLMDGCTDTPACNGADLDGDLDVDLTDFSELAFNWLTPEDLQVYFKLDETGGTTAGDDSIYYRPGTLINGPTWSAEGKSAGALSFDGTNDYVEIPSYEGVTGTAGRTCCAWIKTTAVLQGNILSWGSDLAGQKWTFRVESSGLLGVGIWGGYIDTTTAINDGQWHHVAAVLNDDGSPSVNEILFYVDGILQNSSANNTQSIGTVASQEMILGANKNAGVPGAFFTGMLDEIRVYNRALTQTEIAVLAQ